MIEIRNKYFMQFCWKNHVFSLLEYNGQTIRKLMVGRGGGGGVEVKKKNSIFMLGKRY